MLKPARQRGFNLVEVAVTVSILGILVATAAPSMADWIRSMRVRNMAEAVQNGLTRARTEAMKQNRVVTFWLVSPSNTPKPDAACALASDSGAWVVSVDDPAGACEKEASATEAPRIVDTYGPGSAGDGVTVEALDADGDAATSVRFNPFGQPLRGTDPIARIDFTHAETGPRKLRIQISPSGAVRMCDRDVVSPDPRACT